MGCSHNFFFRRQALYDKGSEVVPRRTWTQQRAASRDSVTRSKPGP